MQQAPRGTADILPEQQRYWAFVHSTLTAAAHAFGYSRIDTPMFEDTRLFTRTVGEETDIVQKEMYTFEDRGGQSLTLRPEGTAAVCRAYIEHGLRNQTQPVRLFYMCPMFRYDRPQAGRYRQFHQFGVEAIGDGSAGVDLEVIQLAMDSMQRLGLGGMTLALNTIGDQQDRPRYIEALREHFRSHLNHLGRDDRRRFETSPLRLLDSKELAGESFMQTAPRSTDYLGLEAQAHWDELLGHLDAIELPYRLDHTLVRGLDYYTRTVFEVHPEQGGAQSAVCAGGRYDGLIEQIGGKPTPGIGFAAGIERLIINLAAEGAEPPEVLPAPLVVAYRGAAAKTAAIRLAMEIRAEGGSATLAPDRSLKAQLRYASGIASPCVLILGDAELAKGIVTCRDMAEGKQREIPLADAPRLVLRS